MGWRLTWSCLPCLAGNFCLTRYLRVVCGVCGEGWQNGATVRSLARWLSCLGGGLIA